MAGINPVLDVEYLNAIGEFCKVYGGWAVAIFEGFFIMFLIRLQRKDRREAAETFNSYHEELVDLVTVSQETKASAASRILEQTREIKTVKEVLQQLVMSHIGGGKVNVEKLIVSEECDEHTITDFLAKQIKEENNK